MCLSISYLALKPLKEGLHVCGYTGAMLLLLTSAGLCDVGMIAVALTPNLKIAAICTSYMVSLFHLFAGFVMTQPDMPGWWYVLLPLPLLPLPQNLALFTLVAWPSVPMLGNLAYYTTLHPA